MMTASGILVLPDNGNSPTIDDIALGLSRQPRFGGQTRRPWSVAEHSLVCRKIAELTEESLLVRAFMLLHDAHEAVTGDTPTTWKVQEVKDLQAKLDRRIFEGLGLRMPNGLEKAVIKRFDEDALLAEARLVGPKGVYDELCKSRGRIEPQYATDAAWSVIDQFGPKRSSDDVAAMFLGVWRGLQYQLGLV